MTMFKLWVQACEKFHKQIYKLADSDFGGIYMTRGTGNPIFHIWAEDEHITTQNEQEAWATYNRRMDEAKENAEFEFAVSLMDDEIREELHREMAPCTAADFFAAYCKAHSEKYGEEFQI